MSALITERGCELWHCDWSVLAERARGLGGVDAVIVDAPYSRRTHAGHDIAVQHLGAPNNDRRAVARRSIDYLSWSEFDVAAFATDWSALARGWVVSITDHILAPVWADALAHQGRYVFAPLPLYSPGSRVRLSGDGPSSWTCWIVVARPRSRQFMSWGTLPGGYTAPPERMPVMGGKPLSAMQSIVRDYSRPGDLVCDPCMGAGTTGLACLLEGRRFLGCDTMLEHATLAVDRLRAMPAETKRGQMALLGGAQ